MKQFLITSIHLRLDASDMALAKTLPLLLT